MTSTQHQPEERTITEATGARLITSIGELTTSMAIANTRLQDIAIKFDRQEQLNGDIERRMKEREVAAIEIVNYVDARKAANDLLAERHEARLKTVEDWKKGVNGILIAAGTTVFITILLGVLYLVFGAKP